MTTSLITTMFGLMCSVFAVGLIIILARRMAGIEKDLRSTLEQLNIANAQLCETAVLKQRLLSQVAFDLRDPLMSIRSAASKIDQGDSMLAFASKPYSERILRDTQRIMLLLRGDPDDAAESLRISRLDS